MKVTICQLYSDLMSTYGDRGNVLYVAHVLYQLGFQPTLNPHRFGEVIPKSTIYVFGGGQDRAQQLVAQDLRARTELKRYLKRSYCLAVCGGYQLLGKYYLSTNGEVMYGLDYLPVVTVAGDKRFVGPVVAARDFGESERTIVGFENHAGRTYINDDSEPLGKVVRGSGNNGIDGSEGIVYGRTIGTYLHGPILPRNPHVLGWWLADLLAKRRDVKLDFLKERLAHREYLEQVSWF